jgi:hypothetical protein
MDRPTVYHRIDTGKARPIQQPPRRLPVVKQAEVGKLLEDMQWHGAIKESNSASSSPVVLIQKKMLDLCLCMDYRKLNTTKKDCFPQARIDNTLDTVPRTKCFSTLDLKSSYW